MKKIFLLSLIIILTLSIIGCSSTNNGIKIGNKLPDLQLAQLGKELPEKKFAYFNKYRRRWENNI